MELNSDLFEDRVAMELACKIDTKSGIDGYPTILRRTEKARIKQKG